MPPDYFSATGQLWGNPIYRWDGIRARWLPLVDCAGARSDAALRHGADRPLSGALRRYFEIPAGETTAVNGIWIKGPGTELFEALERELPRFTSVAENLGRDYAGGGGDSQALRFSRDGAAAICLWERSAGTELPSA